MLCPDGYLKMIDFGFAKHVPKRTFTTCGTPDYLAPEVILQEGHNSACDWWCLGVFLYETHTGFAPFADDDPMKTYRKIVNNKPKYPSGFNTQLESLCRHLLKKDLSKRFGNLVNGVKDIKEHRFMKDLDFEKLLQKKE